MKKDRAASVDSQDRGGRCCKNCVWEMMRCVLLLLNAVMFVSKLLVTHVGLYLQCLSGVWCYGAIHRYISGSIWKQPVHCDWHQYLQWSCYTDSGWGSGGIGSSHWSDGSSKPIMAAATDSELEILCD